ncbi:MAG TPA: cobalamin-independent methionine synthase II family protein [Xanthobacteraceae bacterium]|jgi:5-methyltetrahydropteroyltriglutamate--homocysteine methyltransferase|nr:cobalamin-independent methionine synthase II family protein [Xanthobacteraceae bacterium]
MFVATASRPLATTITGSLPRPAWYAQNLGARPFLAAYNGDAMFREQYVDAIAASISDQSRAGLDIVSDGEMRFDADIGGRSWFGYLFDRMEGLEANVGAPSRELGTPRAGFRARASQPGDILAEFVQTLRPPQVVAPVHAGNLQYDAVWKVAQKMTDKPVKFGSCCGQMIERQSRNVYYKDRRDAVFAFSDALNQEYHRLADAGCQVIQVEEPCLHGSQGAQQDVPFEVYVEAFNREVKGLRAKTEVWCHTCWGNPFAQRLSNRPSYAPTAHWLAQLDVDVITIEAADNGGADIEAVAKVLGKDKKLCIGVLSHRELQVELPEDIAALIRKGLEHVEPDRLLLSSDCGFGRQGMSRTHAYYKMIAMVRGANIVKRELSLPETEFPAGEAKYAL